MLAAIPLNLPSRSNSDRAGPGEGDHPDDAPEADYGARERRLLARRVPSVAIRLPVEDGVDSSLRPQQRPADALRSLTIQQRRRHDGNHAGTGPFTTARV